MQIVIPSRKRAHLIAERTLALFPDAVVTVDEREVADYAPVCAQTGAQLVPHPPLQTLAEICNWILDCFADEIVVIAEDDITRCVSFVGLNVKAYRKPADVRQIVENAAECAKGIGARLFGFTDSANPRNFDPTDPLKFVANLYTLYGFVGKQARSDPRRHLFRDLELSLTELLANRILFCETRFHFESVAPLRQEGGNAVNRARDNLAQANDAMARKWGSYVKVGHNGDTIINASVIKRRQK